MPELSQNKLVKKKFQKKVTDPYGKCEPANIKPWAKQHGEGALGPYAARPHAVCPPKEDSIPWFPRPALCPSPRASRRPREGTHGGISTSKKEQSGDNCSFWDFRAGEDRIRAAGLGAHCK